MAPTSVLPFLEKPRFLLNSAEEPGGPRKTHVSSHPDGHLRLSFFWEPHLVPGEEARGRFDFSQSQGASRGTRIDGSWIGASLGVHYHLGDSFSLAGSINGSFDLETKDHLSGLGLGLFYGPFSKTRDLEFGLEARVQINQDAFVDQNSSDGFWRLSLGPRLNLIQIPKALDGGDVNLNAGLLFFFNPQAPEAWNMVLSLGIEIQNND